VDDRADDREISATPQRKPRISMKDEDTKALLVKLCMNNFDDYQQTKKKNVFMDQMQMMFKEQTGLEVSVKGYMYRWVKDRRKIVEEEKTKSRAARSYGEFDQALDQWIDMVDDATVTLGCFTNGTIAQVVTNSLSPLSGQHLYDGSGATV